MCLTSVSVSYDFSLLCLKIFLSEYYLISFVWEIRLLISFFARRMFFYACNIIQTSCRRCDFLLSSLVWKKVQASGTSKVSGKKYDPSFMSLRGILFFKRKAAQTIQVGTKTSHFSFCLKMLFKRAGSQKCYSGSTTSHVFLFGKCFVFRIVTRRLQLGKVIIVPHVFFRFKSFIVSAR